MLLLNTVKLGNVLSVSTILFFFFGEIFTVL